MGLHAVVLIKQVLDPDLPPSLFSIDPQTRRPAPGSGWQLVIGPFELNALEMALKLKDAGAVARVTAVLAGTKSGPDALRKALAVGADEAVWLDGEGLSELDPFQAAELLSRAIAKLGRVDVVLAGRTGGDWGNGQTASLLAERLGWPCVAFAQEIAPGDGMLTVTRETVSGRQIVAVQPPVVITATNHETNLLRMPKVRDVMKAQRTAVPVWTLTDLGLDAGALPPTLDVLDVWIPPRDSSCEFITGGDPHEVAASLLRRLSDMKVL